MKKKIVLIIMISILVITYLVIDEMRLNKIKNTKYNNYNEIVKVKEDTKIYKKDDEEYIEIGKIKKNTLIYLDKLEIEDDYFKLKDLNYYIDFNLVEKGKEENNIYEKYLFFDEYITTNNSFSLSDKITINESLKLDILIKGEDYYVKFNNMIYSINKNNVQSINEKDKKEESFIDKIPVLNIKSDIGIEEILKYLSENKYISLTLDEYNKWKNNEIRLKENVILIVTNENINNELFDKYNFTLNKSNEFIINNMVSTLKSKNSYEINNTSIDNLKKILNKEMIVYEKAESIPVLNYHFFYSNGQNCNEIICLEVSKFRQHLEYLKNNGYKTLTMTEFIDWYEGKIELPKKSVLITIDDGAMGTSFINGNHLIPLLEEYDLNATLFLITAWWDVKNYQSPNLEVESHGYDIHRVGSCGTQNIKCLSHSELYDDFNKSVQILNSNKSFCYPFYVHTGDAVSVLKELGFKVAFGGGGYNATRNSDRYYIPRYPIYDSITMDEFINMVN